MSDAPSSSYSDPFYDRLDAVANELKKRWWLVVLVLVAVIMAVVVIDSVRKRHPQAAGLAAFLSTQRKADDAAKAKDAWTTLAADQTQPADIRARANIELTQVLLAAGDTASAVPAAQAAVQQATLGQDAQVQLAAKLTLAAAQAQAGKGDEALVSYDAAERAAGAKHPAHQLEAILGAARVLEAQGKKDEAIARLEPLLSRADAGAEALLSVAKVRYWSLKNAPAAAPAAPATPAPAAK